MNLVVSTGFLLCMLCRPLGVNLAPVKFDTGTIEVTNQLPTSLDLKIPAITGEVVFTNSSILNASFSSIEQDKFFKRIQSFKQTLHIRFLKPSTAYIICFRDLSSRTNEECITANTTSVQKLATVQNLYFKELRGQNLIVEWDQPKGDLDSVGLEYGVCIIDAGCYDADNDTCSSFNYSTTEERNCSRVAKVNTSNYNSLDFSEDQEDIEVCVNVIYDSLDSDLECKTFDGFILSNLELIKLDNGSVVIKWDTSDNDTEERFKISFEYVTECECSEKPEDLEGVSNGDVIIMNANEMASPFWAFVFRDGHTLVGKYHFKDVGDSLRGNLQVHVKDVDSSSPSLEYKWCNSFGNHVPAKFQFSVNGSLRVQTYTRFVGCHIQGEVTNLKPYRSYVWNVTVEWGNSDNNIIMALQNSGNVVTPSSVCPKVENLTIILSDDKYSRKKNGTVDLYLPSESTGKISKLKIQIIDQTRQLRRHEEIHPVTSCLNRKCIIKPNYEFNPERKYSILASCANENQTYFTNSESKEIYTPAVVPNIAEGALKPNHRTWYDEGCSNSLQISVKKSLLDKEAGKITSILVLYGMVNTLPHPRNKIIPKTDRTSRHCDYMISSLNKKNGSYKVMAIGPNVRHFFLEDLTINAEYDVMLTYCNSVGYSSSDILRLRMPEFCSNSILIFIIILSIFLSISILVAYVSKWSRLRISIPKMIAVQVSHPEEENFRHPIAKENAKEILQKLLKEPCTELKKQFRRLQEVDFDFPENAASDFKNTSKNRYDDVIPYDHSRVVLNSRPGEPGETYINASYTHGHKKPLAFIACQGPMQRTLLDFWRMVWEKKVRIIIMVTKCKERVEKCSKYWPSKRDGIYTVGEMQIKNLMETTAPSGDYVIRKFQLTKNFTNRAVQQFHFLTWPDKNCPTVIEPLINLVKDAKGICMVRSPSPPTVVHCSAGIGRTGTLIGLWNIMDQINDPSATEIDILREVFHMRLMRKGMIQAMSQYLYLHKCFLYLVDHNCRDASGESNNSKEENRHKKKVGFWKASAVELYSSDEELDPFTDDELQSIDKEDSGCKNYQEINLSKKNEEAISTKTDDNDKTNEE